MTERDEQKLRWAALFGHRVRLNGECLDYTGYIRPAGYGNVRGFNGKQTPAHRVSWALWHDELKPPDGLVVMHTCDNRACVRPTHLRVGTQSENLRDMVNKGRGHWVTNPEGVARGERVALAKLTEALVTEMRQRHRQGESLNAVAAAFGVARSTAVNACKGNTWKHVPMPDDLQEEAA